MFRSKIDRAGSSRSSYRCYASASSAHAFQTDDPQHEETNHEQPDHVEPLDQDTHNDSLASSSLSTATVSSQNPKPPKRREPRYQRPPSSPRGIWKAFKRKMDLSRFATQVQFEDEEYHVRDPQCHRRSRRRSGQLYGEGTPERPVENQTQDWKAVDKAKKDARSQMIPAAYRADADDPSLRRPMTRAQRMRTRPELQSFIARRGAAKTERKRRNMLLHSGLTLEDYDKYADGKPISIGRLKLLKAQAEAPVTDPVPKPVDDILEDVKMSKPAPFDAKSPFNPARGRDPLHVMIDQKAFRLLRKGKTVSGAEARRIRSRLSVMSESSKPHRQVQSFIDRSSVWLIVSVGSPTRRRLADIGEMAFGQDGGFARKGKRKRSRIRTDQAGGSTIASSFYKRVADGSYGKKAEAAPHTSAQEESAKGQPRNQSSSRRLRQPSLLAVRRYFLTSIPTWKKRRKERLIARRQQYSARPRRKASPLSLGESQPRAPRKRPEPDTVGTAPLHKRVPSWPSSQALREGQSLTLQDTELGSARPTKEVVSGQAAQLLAKDQVAGTSASAKRIRHGRYGWRTVSVEEWEQRQQAQADMLAKTKTALLDFSAPSKAERAAEGYTPVPLRSVDLVGLGNILGHPKMLNFSQARLHTFLTVSEIPLLSELLKNPHPPLGLEQARGQDGQRPACVEITPEHQDILSKGLSPGKLIAYFDSAPYTALMFASLDTLGLFNFRFLSHKTRPAHWL